MTYEIMLKVVVNAADGEDLRLPTENMLAILKTSRAFPEAQVVEGRVVDIRRVTALTCAPFVLDDGTYWRNGRWNKPSTPPMMKDEKKVLK